MSPAAALCAEGDDALDALAAVVRRRGSTPAPQRRSAGATPPVRRRRSHLSLEQLKGWVDGPPVIEHLDVVGSYNLFGAQREESAGR
jgi:hypothetical protein